MSITPIRFPDDIAYGSRGGPEFATSVTTTESGYEQRSSLWSSARMRYNVAYGIRSEAQLQTLLGFFRSRRGRFHGFRFKDWSDYRIISATLGQGNAVRTSFQLIKDYSDGHTSSARPITCPVMGTVSVYLDGVLQSSGYSVDYNTGIITFATAPGSGVAIAADAEFDVPVRFDTDRLSIALEDYGLQAAFDIPLVEVRGE